MTNKTAADFLVEVGTEELPPKALRQLMNAFAESFAAGLGESRLTCGAVHAYATPRRLAILVEGLALSQPDEDVVMKGPPVSVAYKDGKITRAGLAFAGKCGIDPAALQQTKTDKGAWLSHEARQAGRASREIVPGLVQKALDSLPIPRRMRWGAGEEEFVRPVHWLIMRHGNDVLSGEVLGVAAGSVSRGHRFHAPGEIEISSPAAYADLLRENAYVVADFEARRERVVSGVELAAKQAGGRAVVDDGLYDEVTALVEWPGALTGSFGKNYLKLPREVLVATLQNHQRYFPLEDAQGNLLPKFVFISNIESKDPQQVIRGNERVIQPRLADASFFWEADRREKLGDRQESLRDVVYQRGLGSVFDKSQRVVRLVDQLANNLGADPVAAARAAVLAKCDLVTDMVGEFPELQGIMGSYYAASGGESAEVAQAVREHYLPRYAGDALPTSIAGQLVALAEKIDTLAGVFVLGKKPSGKRDPFGLRRSALGLVRIIVECGLDFDLVAAIDSAVSDQPEQEGVDTAVVKDDLYDFITERMRAYYLEQSVGNTAEMFESVITRRPLSLLDFDSRMSAVRSFVGLEEASSLAAANKRIANILRRADGDSNAALDEKLFVDDAERRLFAALGAAREEAAPLMAERDYSSALKRLAELRVPVDTFFDDVLVMAEDVTVRRNRLALLAELRGLFLEIADISCLSIS